MSESKESIDSSIGLHNSDELNLIEIFKWFFLKKIAIGVVTTIFSVGSIIYALTTAEIYTADIKVIPWSSSNNSNFLNSATGLASMVGVDLGNTNVSKKDEYLTIAKSHDFTNKFLEENNIKKTIFPNSSSWKAVEKWLRYYFSSNESIKTGVITLSLSLKDPEQASYLVNKLVIDLNNYIREKDIRNFQNRIESLKAELDKSTTQDIKNILFRLMEEQMREINIANSRDEYAFKILDPSVPPEDRSQPNRKRIVIFWTLVGFLLGVIGSFS